jgi:hypothetical protein
MYKMKLTMRYILSALVFLSLFSAVKSQDCTDYHKYQCQYADYTFFYSRQSKSMLSQRGQTSQLRMVAYGGEDYYVAVCAHRKFGDLHFKIYVDNLSHTLIYDNAQDNYATSIIFGNDVTRNLIIDVTVPEGVGKENLERRCVGVVIEFRKQGMNYSREPGSEEEQK